jgi:hypothetical protein
MKLHDLAQKLAPLTAVAWLLLSHGLKDIVSLLK